MLERLLPIITCALAVTTCVASAEEAEPEFRAMWVTAWQTGLLSHAQVDETVRLAKQANLNALVVQVRKIGDAYYASPREPRGENLRDDGFDPLGYIIKRAHESGLEVHAWINTYKVWQGAKPPLSPTHTFTRHPEWINRSNKGHMHKDGQFALDPGVLEAQQHIYQVCMDIVQRYEVDGIHFDYVRYWDRSFGYSEGAVGRFNKETGRSGMPDPADLEWCQWRRDRVTDLVRQVYSGVTKFKPNVKVTAAVICSGEFNPDFKASRAYNLVLQDWEGWLREGIVDAVIPMNYRDEANAQQAAEFRSWIEGMARWKHGRHIYNGIYIRRTDQFVTQIEASRKRGANGFCGFAFNGSYDRAGIARALRARISPETTETPAMQWKQSPSQQAEPEHPIYEAMRAASRGDIEAAIRLLEEAIARDPDAAEAHYRLGTIYLKLGRQDDARREFEATLAIRSSHGGALTALRRMQNAD